MSNPSLPAPSPDAPKSTRDPTHTASSRSGRSDRLRIVRNLLIATENNRAASENMVLAAERTTEAAQEVARVTDDADWTKDNATPGAPEGSPRCEGEFTTPRSLKPDNVPVPVSESRRVRNSLSVFGIWNAWSLSSRRPPSPHLSSLQRRRAPGICGRISAPPIQARPAPSTSR